MKTTYRVTREAWLYGSHYAAGTTITLKPAQAAQYVRDGVLVEQTAEKPAEKPAFSRAKSKPAVRPASQAEDDA